MLLVKTEVRESRLHEKGLYSLQPIKKGTIVMIPSGSLISEAEYQWEQAKDNKTVIMSAVRLLGRYFICADSIGNEEYLNHSSNPNLIYHCGIAIAARDIAACEELTVNYKYFLAEGDFCAFEDAETGELVDGLSPTEAFNQSAEEMLALLKDVLDIDSQSKQVG